ncbi:3D domain-containing protein [Tuberibacillus sp. Marseille-P3662]|uniref:3D domain-containing protein n=1 Tax=Tuberibacillus sp. Marseille-P3662 TaxID=1965358 RepID=UPI000A1CB838|nr:LysM peptidoglycan-binding and 3D domain-containing protein [Tuberibacillus sp. Marseille-P3662]
MKKLVASVTLGIVIAGASLTTASAEEVKVQKGDSLWSIANTYHTSVDDLMKINDLNSTVIHPNQTLLTNKQYTVKKGDTLSEIASQHDIKVDQLKKWNDLESNLITIGQKLAINDMNTSQDPNTAEQSNKNDEKDKKAKKAQADAQTEQKVETKDKNKNEKNDKAQDESFTVTATAYTAKSAGGNGVTATGINLNKNPDAKVIAVDPDVIPLGSKVHVEGYGDAIAGDVGGAIDGKKIDVYFPTKSKAKNWGERKVDVTVVEK